ncbi:MAG: hypothetical protein KIT28_05785 [Rubrivivax sp.]|nr:hypothetical protein [Rubrivivax sp.]
MIARAPRRGDRLPRDDDRAAFLDLVLAARSHPQPESPAAARATAASCRRRCWSPLIEPVVRARAHDPLDADSLRAARARLVVQHPLQPFSRRWPSASAPTRAAAETDAELAAASAAAWRRPPRAAGPGGSRPGRRRRRRRRRR